MMGDRDNTSMQTLLLSRVPVYPPTNGVQIRVWKECLKFSEYGEVLVATPASSTTYPIDGIRHIPIDTAIIARKRLAVDVWNASHILSRLNIYHRLLSRRVVTAVGKHDISPNLIISDFPQLDSAAATLANRHDAPLLLNKHNASHEILNEFLESAGAPPIVRGYAIKQLREFEAASIAHADAVVFQSDADRNHFALPEETLIKTIPNGTDYQQIRDSGNRKQLRFELGLSQNDFICIFVGFYGYFANKEAAKIIHDEIAPALPDVTFLLVGSDPPDSRYNNVYTPGYVDDLSGMLGLADVALCPLMSGSGTKLKMMDYLAAGLPIIATETATSGIDVKDDSTVLVRNDVEAFVREIERLQASPELRAQLSTNALELGKRYDWKVLLADYDELVAQLGLPVSTDGT